MLVAGSSFRPSPGIEIVHLPRSCVAALKSSWSASIWRNLNDALAWFGQRSRKFLFVSCVCRKDLSIIQKVMQSAQLLPSKPKTLQTRALDRIAVN